MDNIQARQESSMKKKLLVPIVVLILLGVGLTGAAYAYSSSVTVNGNTMDANYLSIDLRDGDGTVAPDVISGATFITFTDNYTYAPAKTNQVKYTLSTPVTVAEVYVKVTGDVVYDTLTVTSDIGSKQLAGTNTTEVQDLYNLTYVVKKTNSSGDVVVTSRTLGNAGTMTAPVTADDEADVYYIVITATAIGDAAAYTDVPCGTTTAKAFRDAVNELTFNIGVTATKA